MDTFDPATRSAVMARVRSKANKSTELRLIALMKEAGVKGWRRGVPLRGKPDFVFRTERVLVFVDGCFWHACPRCGEIPASNAEYWQRKIERNRARDLETTRFLREQGWTVVRIWECALRTPAAVMRRLRRALQMGLARRISLC